MSDFRNVIRVSLLSALEKTIQSRKLRCEGKNLPKVFVTDGQTRTLIKAPSMMQQRFCPVDVRKTARMSRAALMPNGAFGFFFVFMFKMGCYWKKKSVYSIQETVCFIIIGRI